MKEQNKRRNANKDQDKQPERKRLVDGPYTRKKRKERIENKNTGQSYVTAKGKEVRKREMKNLPICRTKCRERLVEDVRQGIFNEYWGLGTRDKRVTYIADHSETKETAFKRKRTDDPAKSRNRQVSHSFHFKINGETVKVCRGCFMKILDETQMFITLALDNSRLSLSGIVQPDKRGRHEPKNKHSQKIIQEAIDHIKSFPAHQSHYTRRTNDKKYLAPYLTLQKMYELYCENRKEKVSRRIYEKEFHKLKLAFKKPKVDTCHKCDILQMRLKVAEENENETIQTEIDVHLIEADNVYKQKDTDKTFAKQNECTKCYSFDLQQCLPTPFVNSGVAFYKRQLWTYNLTLHDMGNGAVTCFMWHEGEGGRGGNQIATCLFLQILSLPENIKNVILYSDTCGGQNKNSHVAGMFLTVMQRKKTLETIDHKFMVSGHSHMECDVDHALIEKQKKKLGTEISHPHDWYQLVRSVGKKQKFSVKELTHEAFLNFADLYKSQLVLRKKDSSGDSFKWHDVQWLRYTREPGKIFFKKSLTDEGNFAEICFARRGKGETLLSPKKCYSQKPPISKEKKTDLIQLLPLKSPAFRQFYLDLPTSGDIQDTYPDVEEFDDDET
ncbi:unnamed protein product [Ceutorhynchus assimilis]|uniref:Uncharacterized protein n=1 Tax=Ceutorhynchus assimilis TaxID=467358 RepID=A0A9N9QM96_9CUCU|nr:unnamed protein product [Ceutorhynchus assimilis]